MRHWRLGTIWAAVSIACASVACVSVSQQPRPDPAASAQAFASRRLQSALPHAAPPESGWDRAQWLTAALALNPDLTEARARLVVLPGVGHMLHHAAQDAIVGEIERLAADAMLMRS